MTSRRNPIGTLRILVTEATTGATLVIGGLMVVVAAVGGLSVGLELAAPNWANPLTLAMVGMMYIVPLGAGAIAWTVRDYRRRGVAALAASSARGARMPAVVRTGAVTAWMVLAYLVLFVTIAARSPLAGAAPYPAALMLVPVLLLLVAACALAGLAVGWGSRNRLAPFGLAAVVFGALFVSIYLRSWVGHLSPIDAGTSYPTYLQPDVGLFAARMAGLAGLAVLGAAVLVPRRLVRVLAAVVGLALVAGAVTGVRGIDPRRYDYRAAPRHPACATGTVSLCVRPEDAHQLGEAARILDRVAASLRPFLPVPSRFSAPGMEFDAVQRPGVFVPPRDAYPGVYTEAAVYGILPASCRSTRPDPDATTTPADEAWVDLLTWALLTTETSGEHLVDGTDRIRYGPVLRWSVERQRAWVTGLLRAAARCG